MQKALNTFKNKVKANSLLAKSLSGPFTKLKASLGDKQYDDALTELTNIKDDVSSIAHHANMLLDMNARWMQGKEPVKSA